MTREMQKAIKDSKAEAALLVRYANPKSKSKPTAEQVIEILKRHVPYCGANRPVIKKFTVSKYNRNSIQRSAHFIVELDNEKKWDISAFESLKGRTPEEKEADKTATFPSGLFNIFHDEIKEPEQKEEEAKTMKKTIEGVVCDTKTATKIAEEDNYLYGLWSHTETLYLTADGYYFIATVGNGRDLLWGRDGIRLVRAWEEDFYGKYFY